MSNNTESCASSQFASEQFERLVIERDVAQAQLKLAGEEIERLKTQAVKSERRSIEYGDIVHRQILAMRASVVAWQREGAEIGMQWIANTLAGPGHIPSDEDTAMGAQALFDKEVAEHEAFRAAHPAP